MRQPTEVECNQHYESWEARKTFPVLTKTCKLRCVRKTLVLVCCDFKSIMQSYLK